MSQEIISLLHKHLNYLNLNEIYNLHFKNKSFYKDDDFSLVQSINKVKFIDGEKNNFKITNQEDLIMLKKLYEFKIKN